MTSTTTAIELSAVIEWSRVTPSRIGYFAALHHDVYVALQSALDQDRFEHPRELSELRTTFVERYTTAFGEFRAGRRASEPWQVSFEAAGGKDLCVLQHLLLGMNAHINYDLPIVVATTLRPADLPGFNADFLYVNGVLDSLVNGIAADLAAVFSPLGALNRLFGHEDKLLIDLVIREMRACAWQHALALSTATGAARDRLLDELGRRALELARVIIERRTPARLFMRTIERHERGSIPEVIDGLMRG